MPCPVFARRGRAPVSTSVKTAARRTAVCIRLVAVFGILRYLSFELGKVFQSVVIELDGVDGLVCRLVEQSDPLFHRDIFPDKLVQSEREQDFLFGNALRGSLVAVVHFGLSLVRNKHAGVESLKMDRFAEFRRMAPYSDKTVHLNFLVVLAVNQKRVTGSRRVVQAHRRTVTAADERVMFSFNRLFNDFLGVHRLFVDFDQLNVGEPSPNEFQNCGVCVARVRKDNSCHFILPRNLFRLRCKYSQSLSTRKQIRFEFFLSDNPRYRCGM